MSLASRLAAKEASQNALAAQNDQDQRITLPAHLQQAVQDPSPVTKISVDSLALTKIAKHASEQGSKATGICLGLDVLSTLEISNTFQSYQPIINTGSSDDDERKVKVLRNQYNAKMCRNLHDVDLDDTPVAVYLVVECGATISETLISYAPLLSGLGRNKGFVLVYDHSSALRGNLNLRAYRLHDNFVQALRQNQFSERSLTENQLTFHHILHEYPVEVKASALTNAYVASLSTPHSVDDRTTLAQHPSKLLQINLESPLKGNVDSLVDSVDAYRDEQSQLAFAHRHAVRERGKVEPQIARLQQQRATQGLTPLGDADVARTFKLPLDPSKLPSLVLQGQMDCVSRRLKDVCSAGVAMTHPSALEKKEEVA